MSWLSNAVVNSGSKKDCFSNKSYLFRRYESIIDCNNRECGNPSEYNLFATIQPMVEVNDGMRDIFGESVHGMIVAHYYPQAPEHTSQIQQGVYLASMGGDFSINGFSANGSCADKLFYQGQWWRVVKTSCVEGGCGGCESYDWVCRAVLCLDHCVTVDTNFDELEELIHVPQ